MARRDVIVAFDDIVHGTSSVYSSAFVNMALGELESIALQVIVEPIGTTPDNVTVQIETSADGRNWVSKNANPEVFVTTPVAVQAVGYDSGLSPSLALVRIRVQLGGASAATAHVAVYACEGPNLGFLPSRLTTCALWLRADLGVSLSGSNVTAWNDHSGTGDANKNLTSGSVNPTFTASDASYNNRSTVQISNSVNCFLQNTSTWTTTLTQPHTWVLVGHRNQNNLTNYFMDGNATGFAATVIGTNASPAEITFNAGSSVTTTGSGHDWTSPSVVLVEFNGATSNLYLNSVSTVLQSGNAGAVNFNQLCVGAHSQGFGGGSPWVGTVAEIIAFSGILSAAIKSSLGGYLRDRYAIAVT
jgi:hypothetical protein